jgi:hypothetical protein
VSREGHVENGASKTARRKQRVENSASKTARRERRVENSASKTATRQGNRARAFGAAPDFLN